VLLPPRNGLWREALTGNVAATTCRGWDQTGGFVMKKSLLLSVSALVLMSSMAGAADMPVRYVPPVAAAPCCQGWEGFYFGVYFGSGKGRYNQTTTESSSSNSTFSTPTFLQTSTNSTTGGSSRTGDVTGSVVNLFTGYNWQPNPYLVIGGQLEGTVFSDITGKSSGPRSSSSASTSTVTPIPGVATTTTSTSTSNSIREGHDELRSMFSFLGRAGVLVNPSVLLYVIGGGTIGNFVIPDNFSSGEDSFGGKRSKWVLGYTAGAGGEVKLNKNWLLRAEYRYLNFKYDRDATSSSSSTSTSGTTISASSGTSNAHSSNKFDIHLGTIGVAYRFCYCD
jgi:opacity protein-like surface antigen